VVAAAARQPGKTRRRIWGDYRAINDITLLHQYPVKDAREVTAEFIRQVLRQS
jgi:hypothetical protein